MHKIISDAERLKLKKFRAQIEFSRNYTKLAMLSFLYCFIVKGKLISAKILPPVGFEPEDTLVFLSQCLSH